MEFNLNDRNEFPIDFGVVASNANEYSPWAVAIRSILVCTVDEINKNVLICALITCSATRGDLLCSEME